VIAKIKTPSGLVREAASRINEEYGNEFAGSRNSLRYRYIPIVVRHVNIAVSIPLTVQYANAPLDISRITDIKLKAILNILSLFFGKISIDIL
jgi:hypothetical protein